MPLDYLVSALVTLVVVVDPVGLTATLLLAGQAGGQPLLLATLLGVIIVAMALCLCVFLIANRIDRLLGVTGNVVASRLLGVLLAALAVQFVIDGVKDQWSV